MGYLQLCAHAVYPGEVAAPKFLCDIIHHNAPDDILAEAMRDAYATHCALMEYIRSGKASENKRGWMEIPVNVPGFKIYLKDVAKGGIHLHATPTKKNASPDASSFSVKATPDGIYSCYRENLHDSDGKAYPCDGKHELKLLAGPLKEWFKSTIEDTK